MEVKFICIVGSILLLLLVPTGCATPNKAPTGEPNRTTESNKLIATSPPLSASFTSEVDPEVSKLADITIQKQDGQIVYLIRLHEDMPASKYLIFQAYDSTDKFLGEIDIKVAELPNISQPTQNKNEFIFRTSSNGDVGRIKVTLDNSTHGPSLPIGPSSEAPPIPLH
jgi:hypothetical protein